MTKGDKYLIVFIVIISLVSLIYVKKNSAFNYEKKYISIQVDGKEIKKIIFDKKTSW